MSGTRYCNYPSPVKASTSRRSRLLILEVKKSIIFDQFLVEDGSEREKIEREKDRLWKGWFAEMSGLI